MHGRLLLVTQFACNFGNPNVNAPMGTKEKPVLVGPVRRVQCNYQWNINSLGTDRFFPFLSNSLNLHPGFRNPCTAQKK